MGLRKRPCRRRTLRYCRRSRAAGVLAAARAWECDQPLTGDPHPSASGHHAELRAANHLANTTDA